MDKLISDIFVNHALLRARGRGYKDVDELTDMAVDILHAFFHDDKRKNKVKKEQLLDINNKLAEKLSQLMEGVKFRN